MKVLEEKQRKVRVQKDILCYVAQNSEVKVNTLEGLLTSISEYIEEITLLCHMSRKNTVILFPSESMARFYAEYLGKQLTSKNVILEGSASGVDMYSTCKKEIRNVLCLFSEEAWKQWVIPQVDILIVAGIPASKEEEHFEFLMRAAKYKLDLNTGNRILGVFDDQEEWMSQKARGLEKTRLLKDVSLFLSNCK